MTQRPQPVLPCLPGPPGPTQKAQLAAKVLLLQNARNMLDRELRSLTDQAYGEVQGFLNSSLPASVFCDLLRCLDAKCQALNKALATLKDVKFEAQFHAPPTGENGARTNQTCKEILAADVPKLGPTLLTKALSSCSMSKVIQVLGSSLSLRQLRRSESSGPGGVQDRDAIQVGSSGQDTAEPSAFSSLEAEEEARAVNLRKKCRADAVTAPPAVIHSPRRDTERSSQPCPEPTIPEPLIRFGSADDAVQVPQQKQTCAQLSHCGRTTPKNITAVEPGFVDHDKSLTSAQTTSPVVKMDQRTDVGDDGQSVNAPVPPQRLSTVPEVQTPAFRATGVEPDGGLIYSCLVGTETELWDVYSVVTQWRFNKTGSMLTIPEFQCRLFEEFEVIVSHVVSPDIFYIQRRDGISKLKALLSDTCKGSSSYAEQNCVPHVGTPVLGRFPGQEDWWRARVTKICGLSSGRPTTDSYKCLPLDGDNGFNNIRVQAFIKLEVKRLDHGDTACLSLMDVKELPPEMAACPLQAIQVSLANVMPKMGTDWTKEALSWFRAAVRGRTFYARLNRQGPRATAELFFEKGKLGAMRRSASMSVRMAQNGYAKHKLVPNVDSAKPRPTQPQRTKQECDWESFVISYYAQHSNRSIFV